MKNTNEGNTLINVIKMERTTDGPSDWTWTSNSNSQLKPKPSPRAREPSTDTQWTAKKKKKLKRRRRSRQKNVAKGKKGRPSFLGCGRRSLWLNRFGHARSEGMRDGGRTRTRMRTRTRETANAKGVRGMGMGNGLLSSFGAWPGPKRPVKVIGKVTEIVAHSTLGAGQ